MAEALIEILKVRGETALGKMEKPKKPHNRASIRREMITRE
jgi:hypothetical protein